MLMIKDQTRISAPRAPGAQLVIARNEAGLTQSAMAKTAKVSFRAYLTCESGQGALLVDVCSTSCVAGIARCKTATGRALCETWELIFARTM